MGKGEKDEAYAFTNSPIYTLSKENPFGEHKNKNHNPHKITLEEMGFHFQILPSHFISPKEKGKGKEREREMKLPRKRTQF